MSKQRISLHNCYPSLDTFLGDVLKGLNQSPRSIPPIYFYDQKGSQIFDQITELDEYYPTRTEIQILEKHIAEIAQKIGKDSILLEPGGGAFTKVHIVLQGLQPKAYIPIDISKDYLWASAKTLAEAYDSLQVHAVCADFSQQIILPPSAPEGPKSAFFPGSSIGNFHPEDAIVFLQKLRHVIDTDGYLLIGVDLKKDSRILEAAYDDDKGVTAEFNLNLLTRMNTELGADFELNNWSHNAIYSEQDGRIEMHLISNKDQTVTLEKQSFHFKTGESIHTENSYKYSVEEFQQLVVKAGFEVDSVWTDDDELFSVHLFKAVA